MFFKSLALVGATTSGMVSAMATPKLQTHVLSEHDIIAWGKDGRIEILNKMDHPELSEPAHPPSIFDNEQYSNANNLIAHGIPVNGSFASNFGKRCNTQTFVVPGPTEHFTGWDVPMSAVVHATGTTNLIAVTEGYTITNSISVSEATQLTLVKDYLTTTYTTDYTQSWASSYVTAYTFGVPEGKYGVIVSNPQTTRQSGFVATGCVGSNEYSTSYYQADSFQSKSQQGLAWVEGTIGLCLSDTYPIPRCLGQGTLS